MSASALGPAIVHWGTGGAAGTVGWQDIKDTETVDTGLGVFVADLPTTELQSGRVDFTFYWPEVDRWEGVDFRVAVGQV